MAEPQQQSEGLRARKKREMRRRIVDTAGRLFAEKGFAGTRVEEIAAALDVSNATVFNYFGSKDAILLELAEEQITRFEVTLEPFVETLEDDGEGLELMDRIPKALDEAFAESPRINRRLSVEIMRVTLPSEAGARIARRIHRALERLLARAQRNGEIRDDLRPDQLAVLFADMLTGAFNNWLNDASRPLGERLDCAIAFMRDAVRAS